MQAKIVSFERAVVNKVNTTFHAWFNYRSQCLLLVIKKNKSFHSANTQHVFSLSSCTSHSAITIKWRSVCLYLSFAFSVSIFFFHPIIIEGLVNKMIEESKAMNEMSYELKRRSNVVSGISLCIVCNGTNKHLVVAQNMKEIASFQSYSFLQTIKNLIFLLENIWTCAHRAIFFLLSTQ